LLFTINQKLSVNPFPSTAPYWESYRGNIQAKSEVPKWSSAKPLSAQELALERLSAATGLRNLVSSQPTAANWFPAMKLMDVVAFAYSQHYIFRLSPHDLWFQVLTEIATLVKDHADAFEHIFTRKTGEKTTIEVQTDDIMSIDVNRVLSSMKEHVPVDTDLFLPSFSTTTPAAQVAMTAAFLDMASPYYNYMTFMCGLRGVEVMGTEQDWQLFSQRATALASLLGQAKVSTPRVTAWLQGIAVRANKIGESLAGGDSSFYKDTFTTENVGSGGELVVSGWFGREFFINQVLAQAGHKLDCFPSSLAVVSYKNRESERTFKAVHGCLDSRFEGEGEGLVLATGYGHMVYETTGAADQPKPRNDMVDFLKARKPGLFSAL
jgi:hypothetical protein